MQGLSSETLSKISRFDSVAMTVSCPSSMLNGYIYVQQLSVCLAVLNSTLYVKKKVSDVPDSSQDVTKKNLPGGNN
jgi:hypothetical protein